MGLSLVTDTAGQERLLGINAMPTEFSDEVRDLRVTPRAAERAGKHRLMDFFKVPVP
jgi:hypothetical protein